MNHQLMDFERQLNGLCAALEAWRSTHFQHEISALGVQRQDFLTQMTRFDEARQHLSIGIIGQVKAGKSSFLNALLFDGRPVLPEAATPKTANLTRIAHGPAPVLTVEYYSPQEWAGIVDMAAGVAQDDGARVARELVNMARDRGVDIAATLAKGSERLVATHAEQLPLNDYAGENGRYTALVKATSLELPMEELRGLDLVDTPGMNDPVISRTQKTKEYMAQCDVVFFLSRCSQFLDQSDTDLLHLQLPGKGVKRIVLVAGQYDSVLLDDGYDRSSLAATEDNIKSRLSRRAAQAMDKLANERQAQGRGELAAMLHGLRAPVFASTFAHGFASWPEHRWNKNMHHVHGQMQAMARQCWNGAVISNEDWARLANFDALKAAYEQARLDKHDLLEQQRQDVLPRARRELGLCLRELTDAVQRRAQQLQTGDLATLERQRQACEHRIADIVTCLTQEVDKHTQAARRTRDTMLAQLKGAMADFSNLKEKSGTETHTSSHEVSTSRWYNPFSWGNTETVYRSYTSSYTYMAAADAVEQVLTYGRTSAADIEHAFARVVNRGELLAALRSALLRALDTDDAAFDPGHFRRTLQASMERLVLPELQLEVSGIGAGIGSRFKGEIRDPEHMARLRASLTQALQDVFQDIGSAFELGVAQLCQQLDGVRASLEQQMVADLRQELSSLQQAFADKENDLAIGARIAVLAAGVLATLETQA